MQINWGFYDHVPTDPEVLGRLITVACNMYAILSVFGQYSYRLGMTNCAALEGDLEFCKDHFGILAENLIARLNLHTRLDIVSRMRIPLNWIFPVEIRMELFPYMSDLNR